MTIEPKLESEPRRGFDSRLFTLILIAVLALLAAIAIFWLDRVAASWTRRDVARETSVIAAEIASAKGPGNDRERLAESLARHQATGVAGALLCFRERLMARAGQTSSFDCGSAETAKALLARGSAIDDASLPFLISASRLSDDRSLILFSNRAYFADRHRRLLRRAASGGLVAIAAIALFGYLGIRATRRSLRKRLASMISTAFDTGDTGNLPKELSPVIDSIKQSVAARTKVVPASPGDGPARLRQLVAERMPDTPLVLVANREPYLHQKQGDSIRVDRPASGLVTGVEPLLKACGGVWIAHGSGSADREVSDERGRVQVPPEDPEYVLRRIWLTRREEEGYYLGFSNEGLWPLCHIAHTRPVFRPEDFDDYTKVNQRFAAAAAEEAGKDGAIILVQDYHFALLPQMLRELSPKSVISLFWHIPWPNHEVIGICPWRVEVLKGMLGADVIGFHTRYHCLNFLETVQRYLEARVDLDTMSVEYQGHRSLIKAYPISVEWPYQGASEDDGKALREQLGVPADVHVSVSVDRADYTKGLLEKIEAIDFLLTSHPEVCGKFVFYQLAAPSRTDIRQYRDLNTALEEAVRRVNQRHRCEGVDPIVLQLRGHKRDEVRRFYAMADSALVTPLHDGMNLVAKEYAAGCRLDRGILILSSFAGAARELDGALLVNPYDVKDVAGALLRAMQMAPEERLARMKSMRAAIERNSIYDWSASILSDMAEAWDRNKEAWRDRKSEE